MGVGVSKEQSPWCWQMRKRTQKVPTGTTGVMNGLWWRAGRGRGTRGEQKSQLKDRDRMRGRGQAGHSFDTTPTSTPGRHFTPGCPHPRSLVITHLCPLDRKGRSWSLYVMINEFVLQGSFLPLKLQVQVSSWCNSSLILHLHHTLG